MTSRRFHTTLLWLWILALIVSAIGTADPFTWMLEVAPAILGVIALAATYRRFPFTNLVYGLIFIHSLILMLGGHSMRSGIRFNRIGEAISELVRLNFLVRRQVTMVIDGLEL